MAMSMPVGRTGSAIADTKIVALYQPDSGDIAHMHVVMTFPGGRAVGDQEAIEAARRHAAIAGRAVEGLRVAVSGDRRHAAHPHRIDLRSGTFVPVEIAGGRRGGTPPRR